MSDFLPQVSVIVPVYNVENYLPQCIESVLAQTFPYFELLLINDGSTDRSGEICDKYALLDTRIRVYHRQNRGVSATRNFGIEQARCEWLSLIDSDDYVGEEYLAAFMLQGHLTEDCMNLQGWKCINSDGQVANKVCFPDLFAEMPGMAEMIVNYQIFSNNAPWAKLFNRNMIRRYQLSFPEGVSTREDAIFSYSYRRHIKSIRLLPASAYCYRLPQQRITLSHFNHRPEPLLYVRAILPSLIKDVFQEFELQGSLYECQNISYFKNSTDISIIKSIYFYNFPRTERIKILRLVLGKQNYDHAFRAKPLLKSFKIAYRLLSVFGVDLFFYLLFSFYYRYIRK